LGLEGEKEWKEKNCERKKDPGGEGRNVVEGKKRGRERQGGGGIVVERKEI